MKIIAVISGLGVLAGCGEDRLDSAQAERALRGHYDQVYPVASVNCPDHIQARMGTKFSCTLVFRGGSDRFAVEAEIDRVESTRSYFTFRFKDPVFEPGPTATLLTTAIEEKTGREVTIDCGEPRRRTPSETCAATFADGGRASVVVAVSPEGVPGTWELVAL